MIFYLAISRESCIISSHPSRHRQDVPVIGGLPSDDSVLAQSSLVSPTASSSGSGGPSSPAHSGSGHRPPDGPSPTQPPRPPSHRLAAFRRCRNFQDADGDTIRLLAAGWRLGTTDRYERAWVAFEGFLVTRGLSLNSITLKNGLDYLAHLFK